MRTIWRFPLKITDYQTIRMPFGARPLSVALRGTTPCLWCEVESDNTPAPRSVFICGTGNPFPANLRDAVYVGLVQTHGGVLAWHVYVAVETVS
jgi:hypothetical protein